MEPVRAGDTDGIRTRMHRCTNLRLCHLSYGAMLPPLFCGAAAVIVGFPIYRALAYELIH